MQIVTDSGADLTLSPEQLTELNIHFVPLSVTLEGTSYREGVDIETGQFYRMLSSTDSLPTTSQPSAGDFAATYRQLAATDPDILSIHITAALSGTFAAAQTGAGLVPEARVTHFDTRTLSAAAGWQVEAAAHAVKAGWQIDKVLALAKDIGDATDVIFTLRELKYLIHGGRVGHMKGLVGSALRIKPLLAVDKASGTLKQLRMVRSFDAGVRGLVDLILSHHPSGSALKVQALHADNLKGMAMLHELVDQRFDCTWLEEGNISLVLGAHSGPSLVGIAFAPSAAFANVP